jgi:Fe-S-cluster containining protein
MTDEVKTANVPCNGCTACCQGDLIILKPHLGDVAQDYTTYFDGQNFILEHKKNRDCIYLDRSKGCTIYDRRPVVCRGLDCRFILKLDKKTLADYVQKGMLTKRLVKAAKKLSRNYH